MGREAIRSLLIRLAGIRSILRLGHQRIANVLIGGLDCDRKAPSRVALRAFENADIITRCCGFDARQPHGLAAFGAWKDSDLCTAEYWIGMDG